MQPEPAPRPAGDDPFSAATVAAIIRHMDADHAEDSLTICRHFGALPDASSARLVALDPSGATFEATVAGRTEAVHLPWAGAVHERRQVREEIVAMLDRARAAGGLPPRDEVTH